MKRVTVVGRFNLKLTCSELFAAIDPMTWGRTGEASVTLPLPCKTRAVSDVIVTFRAGTADEFENCTVSFAEFRPKLWLSNVASSEGT